MFVLVDDRATNSTAIEAIQTLLGFYATCQLAVMKLSKHYLGCSPACHQLTINKISMLKNGRTFIL